MTRVTVVGMVVDPIVERDSLTSSPVAAGSATATSTVAIEEFVIAIAIGNTIDGGAGDR
jgi:hypothetical protein